MSSAGSILHHRRAATRMSVATAEEAEKAGAEVEVPVEEEADRAAGAGTMAIVVAVTAGAARALAPCRMIDTVVVRTIAAVPIGTTKRRRR